MGSALGLARLIVLVACAGCAHHEPVVGVVDASTPPAAHSPKLQILDPEIRITVTDGEVVTRVFRIRNVGDAPLVIRDISGGVEWTGPDGVTVKIGGRFVGWDGQPR